VRQLIKKTIANLRDSRDPRRKLPRARPSVRVRRAGLAPPQAVRNELRLGAIDVGSNSIHLVVAQIDAQGALSILWQDKEMVGLGRTSFPSHRLSRVSMERAMITLRRFVADARRWQCEDVVAIATSAVREAANGGEFIERVRSELGLHLRVVSARDEARLIYLGVRHGMELRNGPHLIVDVGGGSVEFIVADAEQPLLLESRKLGAARMTAKFIRSDPVEPREIQALLAHYDRELSPLADQILRLGPVRAVGTSGTIENLIQMAATHRPSDGRDGSPEKILTRGGLKAVLAELLETRSADRARLKGLDDKRKDQIVAGALLVDDLFRRLGLEQIGLCTSALREGMLMDYLGRHRPELEVRREIPDPRRRAVVDLGRRCHWQRDHGEQVARLCLRLFDQLRSLHGLGRDVRELVEYGALLHDVGRSIGQARHHKHSRYLILNGGLDPFTRDEVRTIACIARYHRRSFPSAGHRLFRSLPKRLRRAVGVGSALLRIADGLDRTNCSVVSDVICRTRPTTVDIVVDARGDAELELWSAEARSKLFRHLFRRSVVLSRLK
jgi:exopolyphosphatase/guanosine-5'-triphosphate,3'-diphosphate pyrophosphatase